MKPIKPKPIPIDFKSRLKLKKKEKKKYDTSPVQIKYIVDEDDDLNEEIQDGTEYDGITVVKSSRSAEDDVFESLNGSSRRDSFKFEPNSKYTTIFIYSVIFVISAVLIVAGLYKGVFFTAISKFFKAINAFVIGFFIALILDPPTNWLDKHLFEKCFKLKSNKARRILSMLITYILVIGLLFVLVRFVVPQIGRSISDLFSAEHIDAFINTLYTWIHDLEKLIPGMELGAIEAKLSELDPKKIIDYATNIVPQLFTISINIAKGTWNALIALIVSMYILYDKRNLKILATKFVYSIFPVGRANRLSQTTKECTSIFVNFVFGKSLDSLIIGMLTFVVLSIANYPYAILIAMIIGVTNMIPYFGPFIGAVPGVFIYLVNCGFKQTLIFVLIVFLIQQLDGWVIGPKIVGDSTGLSPLWVILGTTLGGAYGGVIGMFLGVPIVAVIAYLMQRIVSRILAQKKIDIS